MVIVAATQAFKTHPPPPPPLKSRKGVPKIVFPTDRLFAIREARERQQGARPEPFFAHGTCWLWRFVV